MAKHFGILAGLAFACSMTLPALAQDEAAPATDVTAETVVASVNGTDITLGELIILREKLPAQYQSLPDDILFKGLIDQAIQQLDFAKARAGSNFPLASKIDARQREILEQQRMVKEMMR